MPYDWFPRNNDHSNRQQEAWSSNREEDWREMYASRTYAGDQVYEQLRPAYFHGWESRAQFGDRSWEEIEEELARRWELAQLSGGLSWQEARAAVQDAWTRAGSVRSQGWTGARDSGRSYGNERGGARTYGRDSEESGRWIGGSGYGSRDYGESGHVGGGYGRQGSDIGVSGAGSNSGGYGGYGYSQSGGNYGAGGYGGGSGEYGHSHSRQSGGGYGRGYTGDAYGHGYSPSREEGPYVGRGPRSYQRSNERVKEDLCERLTVNGQVDASNIEIKVENGEVVLAGGVGSNLQKRLAEEVAGSVTGVLSVHNRLRVERPESGRVGGDPMGGLGSLPVSATGAVAINRSGAASGPGGPIENEGTGGGPPSFSPPPPPPPPSDDSISIGPKASAYALLDCEEIVIAEREFDLTVGISPKPMVEGDEPLEVPAAPEYTLVVHVIAEGFRLREGEMERNELRVTPQDPYPSLVLHLTPQPQDIPVRLRRIRANYSTGGQAIGFANRPVAVVESDELATAHIPRLRLQPGTVHAPTAKTASDLTINIRLGDSVGELLWSIESPHKINLSKLTFKSDIGGEPDKFARQLVTLVNAREGATGLYAFLIGIGQKIALKVPSQIWSALRQAARQRGGLPDVLILSQEPYVPWELAVMPEPWLSPAPTPPFLAAQANIGRWVIRRDSDETEADDRSTERPVVPPPTGLAVKGMAVVSGIYEDRKWRRLEEAEKEASELTKLYPAETVNAEFQKIADCLEGTPTAELLHFAVHGSYNPSGLEDGLMLVDKRILSPFDVMGRNLKSAPFVFLNACQVGSGAQILGDYAGLAEAFLYAGASGVIAPLWSIKDEIARQIALDFYREIAAGCSPASIVRAARARFKDSPETVSATYLAYQFFGHPQLKLNGLQLREVSQA